MKQPDLGKKIASLRKAKGLTQEELVEKCRISVRTIQRIETGEVTPRSYTIKTILAALGHDPKEILAEETDHTEAVRWINFAWIAGIAYFLLGFPEGIMDFIRFAREAPPELVPAVGFLDMDFSTSFYIFIKLLALITYGIFVNGFIQLGTAFSKALLKISAFVLVTSMIFIIGYDVGTLVNPTWSFLLVNIGIAEIFGLLVIIFGVGLIQLQSSLGAICIFAGLLEILAGFLTMFLTPFGLLIQMPAEILEVIILYQSVKMLSTSKDVENLT